jgi:hypothetical protein
VDHCCGRLGFVRLFVCGGSVVLQTTEKMIFNVRSDSITEEESVCAWRKKDGDGFSASI